MRLLRGRSGGLRPYVRLRAAVLRQRRAATMRQRDAARRHPRRRRPEISGQHDLTPSKMVANATSTASHLAPAPGRHRSRSRRRPPWTC